MNHSDTLAPAYKNARNASSAAARRVLKIDHDQRRVPRRVNFLPAPSSSQDARQL